MGRHRYRCASLITFNLSHLCTWPKSKFHFTGVIAAHSKVSPAGRRTAQRRSWPRWRWGSCRPSWWRSSSCWSSGRLAGDTLWQMDLATTVKKINAAFKASKALVKHLRGELFAPTLKVFDQIKNPTKEKITNTFMQISSANTRANRRTCLTCSGLAVGPHQVLALGNNHCEALCCR